MDPKTTTVQLTLAFITFSITQCLPTGFSAPGYFSKEWYRCHGLPCQEVREVDDILMRLGGGTETILNDGRHSKFPEEHNEEAMDIWFTRQQALDLLQAEQERNNSTQSLRRFKRKVASFSKNPEQKWDLPILYKFDETHTYEDKEIIRAAFKHWMDNTCLIFFEVNREAELDRTHLVVTNNDPGRCASFIGRAMSDNKPQQINLGSSCLKKFGTPVHEIGHALGLWHEHQRGDRQHYIDILSMNIGWWAKANFVTAPDGYMEYYDIPYDFNSVMHYGPLTGTMFGKPTIQARNELFQFNMGQRISLSFLDSKAINRAYCANRCKNPLSKRCYHSGYQDPLQCNSCRCPTGLSGRYCEHLAPSTGVCGGTVYLDTHQNRTITSPGYIDNKNYQENVECNWLVKAPPGHTVILRFQDEFGIQCAENTCLHWVEVNTGPNFGIPGPRFCCSETPDINLESYDDELLITMRSNFSSADFNRRGFKAIVTAIPPGGANNNPQYLPPSDSDISARSKREQTTRSTTTTTTIPTTTTKPTTTTQSTTTTSTQKPTTKVPTVLNRQIIEYSWSEWSSCFGHDCNCGGCSVQIRELLCNRKRCSAEHAMSQTRDCDRLCTNDDTQLYFAGRIFIFRCPECCPGYYKENGKCVLNNW